MCCRQLCSWEGSGVVDIFTTSSTPRTATARSKSTNLPGASRKHHVHHLCVCILTHGSWTAICRGAVLKALTNSSLPGPTVKTRISRCNYGTRYHTDFNPMKHIEFDRYIDPVSGRPKARNQLQWYLERVSVTTLKWIF